MKSLQRTGGLAALYLAIAYLVGLVLFIVVLDYINIVDPAQKAALIVEQQMVIYCDQPVDVRVLWHLAGDPGAGAA